MKILAIGSVYPRHHDDQEVPWLRESHKHLVSRGVEVEVLAPAWQGLTSHTVDGIQVHRFRYAPAKYETLTHDEGAPSKMHKNPLLQLLAIPYIISGTMATLWHLRRGNFDILHIHWPFPHGIFGVVAQVFCKTPVVLNYHGASLLLMKKHGWIKPIMEAIIKRSQAILCNSSFTQQIVQQLTDKPIYISPYGSAIPYAANRKSQIVNRKSPFSVLFVGRHIERKGIIYLIEAMSLLKASHSFTLRIVGEGSLTDSLKAAAQGQAHIHFTGKLSPEDLMAEYKQADAFCLPSIIDSKGDTEGLGVVLIEAIQNQLPIIASDVGGIPDVIIDKQTGLLVPPKNPKAIVAALELLANCPKLCEQLTAQALKHAQAYFDWDRITVNLIKIYTKISNDWSNKRM